MCELFGMSSRWPTEVTVSLDELARHGSRSGLNREGWGIAYYEERDTRLVKEPGAAAESPCLRFVEQEHLASNIVVAHIRHASQGAIALRNTHPFQRELGGRMHVFAHNGDLPGLFADARFAIHRFHPVGETDSEYAFCALMERLVPTTGLQATRAQRLAVVGRFAAELAALGPANFLYSDGDTLFAHGDRRSPDPSQPPRAPGLHLLHHEPAADAPHLHAGGVRIAAEEAQRIALVASVPLSHEAWQPLPQGAVVAFADGRAVDTWHDGSLR